MKTFISNFKKGLQVRSQAEEKYRALQKHLDTMPVGFPATFSGVELRILRSIFTAEEAEAALLMSWRPETFAEIFKKARGKGYKEEKLRKLIDSISEKGGIFTTKSGNEKRYSLHPLIIGMYELQNARFTSNLYLDLREYMNKKFAMEYYTTEARQMRVIPVRQSLNRQLAVAAYDDIRDIVDRAKNGIGIINCICRRAKDELGQPCKKTDRREVCMGFRDYHKFYSGIEWGRTISKNEAFKILDQNEKDGLILMPSTHQDPQFVCSCCSCCCGISELVSMFPRPVDFVESNYRVQLKPETCVACGICETRCNMEAIKREGKKAIAIDEKKCVGCGLCVSTCKSGSLKLMKKEKEFVPPKDHVALMELIEKNKKSTLGKGSMMLKAMMGFKV